MPDIAAFLPMLGLLLAIGAFAGVIAGLLGVGGGIVLVPAFFYAFGHLGYGGPQLMQVCLATSLATIVVTSVRSILGHHRKGAVDWAILRAWGPYIAAGALGGVLVAASLKSVTLQAIFGILALIAGLYMAFGRDHWRLGPQMPAGPCRAGLGGSLGFFSSLMGIGGGTFGVPMMTLYSLPIHRAVATAAGFGLMIAVPSAIGYLFLAVENPPIDLVQSFGALGINLDPVAMRALGLDPRLLAFARQPRPRPFRRTATRHHTGPGDGLLSRRRSSRRRLDCQRRIS